ncbi:MAG: DNA methylase N-4 [Candidatus Marinimicrobia bacterium]|nr:DNA methylase N-4 [Candidatus Neomarinimicrobiota bacterium]
MEYKKFLEKKIITAPKSGIEIKRLDISDKLFEFQKDIVLWAIHGGSRAIFASFGLGKTLIQLEIMRLLNKIYDCRTLIIMPLGVRQEFKEMSEMIGIKVEYIKTNEDILNSENKFFITNYERVRDGNIDVNLFEATSLDEASVLRSYGSKTYQTFLNKFKNIKYKFVATATPSPNKFKELIHYAGYLGVMDTGQALTRFFKRDSTKANNLTLHPHKEEEFWIWMSTWALFIQKPSDLGYSNDGYDMPELIENVNIFYHEIPINHNDRIPDKDGTLYLFKDAILSLPSAAKEKRDTLSGRIDKMMQIMDTESHYLLWHDLEIERHAIRKALPESTFAYGSQDIDKREQVIIDFSKGKSKYLATKPSISGSGSNFQHFCHKAIFLGIGYKFNDFIQSIHRIVRFGQLKKPEIHIIYAESEREILKTLKNKWKNHKILVKNMTEIIKKNGLSNTNLTGLKRNLGIKRNEVKSKLFTWINNDSVDEWKTLPDNKIRLIHTSIPFSNHYEYTPTYNDFGHTVDNVHFFEQMDFLTPELLRTLVPGGVAAIHVKDRILFGNATGDGMPTLDPFSDMTVFHFLKHKFRYFGRITIETDVVRENNQTYRLGWTEQTKDGSKMGVGCPEYILLFRKLPTDTTKAYADIPVSKTKENYTRGQWQIDARAKWNSSGDRFLTSDELKRSDIKAVNKKFTHFFENNIYNYKNHVETANELDKFGKLPATFETLKLNARNEDIIWHNINRMLTLNGSQSRKNLNMHICPLQFDIVDRIINRFSNKGDIIADPFAGLGTVPNRAVKMGRVGYGCELNIESWFDGLQYLRAVETNALSPTLFSISEL